MLNLKELVSIPVINQLNDCNQIYSFYTMSHVYIPLLKFYALYVGKYGEWVEQKSWISTVIENAYYAYCLVTRVK